MCGNPWIFDFLYDTISAFERGDSMSRKSYQIDMANGSLVDKILIFSLPLMLSSVLQLLFNAADIVVVGRFASSNSLAAVGSTGALINLIVNVFVGLSIGTNVVVARFLGAQDYDNIKKTVHTSIYVALLSGVFLAIFGFFASRTLLIWMDTPVEVLDLASLYLKIYFLGMPASMVYNFGAAILRAQGDTKRPLYFLSIAGVVNVIFNLFLVIVMHMDVAGVAIATITSQYISAILIILCLRLEEGALQLNLKELALDFNILKEMAKIGLPAGLQGSVFSLSNVVIQTSINSFGAIVMAGNSAAANIEGFVYVAMNAFYQSALTFTGQSVGAKNYDRVKKILITCLLMVSVTGLVLGMGVYLLGKPLVGIYSQDPLVIEAGIIRLKYVCQIYFLCGMMDVMVGILRGIGYSVMPMIVSLLGACAFRLLWIMTVFQMYRSVDTIYISYPISWAMTFSVHMVCYLAVKGKWLRKMKAKDLAEAEQKVLA